MIHEHEVHLGPMEIQGDLTRTMLALVPSRNLELRTSEVFSTQSPIPYTQTLILQAP